VVGSVLDFLHPYPTHEYLGSNLVLLDRFVSNSRPGNWVKFQFLRNMPLMTGSELCRFQIFHIHALPMR